MDTAGVQVYQKACVFVRLLWQGGQQSVGSELGGKTRLACGLLSMVALRLDAVHSSSELEVRFEHPQSQIGLPTLVAR